MSEAELYRVIIVGACSGALLGLFIGLLVSFFGRWDND